MLEGYRRDGDRWKAVLEHVEALCCELSYMYSLYQELQCICLISKFPGLAACEDGIKLLGMVRGAEATRGRILAGQGASRFQGWHN